MSEQQCFRRLRLTRQVVVDICSLLEEDLLPAGPGGHVLPVFVKVTIGLNFLATGSLQGSAGDISRISQVDSPQMHKTGLFARAGNYVKFACDDTNQNKQALRFAYLAGFPQVSELVHGKHESYDRVPSEEISSSKDLSSVRSMETYYKCESPGRKKIYEFILASQPEGHGWMLEDKGYGLASWLMTPLRNPLTEAEKHYNESHIATQNMVEKTIGVLKQCFRCLDHSGGSLQYHPDQVIDLIIRRGQQMPDEAAGPPPEGGEVEEPAGEEQDEEEAGEDLGEDQPGNSSPSCTGMPPEAAPSDGPGLLMVLQAGTVLGHHTLLPLMQPFNHSKYKEQ
uniref:putative nuclease HARBI1 n=1 Tax=Pristiophorus japonicus TaxID=55135 RepID=UPI00398EF4AB